MTLRRKIWNYAILSYHSKKKKIVDVNTLYEFKVCIQNYWVFGLCPSSGILENRKRFGNLLCFRLQVKLWKALTLLGPLEGANLIHWTCSRSRESILSSLYRVYFVSIYNILMWAYKCNILYKGGRLRLNISAWYSGEMTLCVDLDLINVGLKRNAEEARKFMNSTRACMIIM
jgi:hypothetical protein